MFAEVVWEVIWTYYCSHNTYQTIWKWIEKMTEREGRWCLSSVQTDHSKGRLRVIMPSNGVSNDQEPYKHAGNFLAVKSCSFITFEDTKNLYNVLDLLMTINERLCYHCQSKRSVLRTNATGVLVSPFFIMNV